MNPKILTTVNLRSNYYFIWGYQNYKKAKRNKSS